MASFFIIPDIINIVLVLLSIRQMYHGIEISHPVYSILFCDLVSASLASISEIMILLLVSELKTATIVKGCTLFSLLFHHCCWCVVSILRYLYIIESDWLHWRFQEHWKLTAVSITAVYLFYTASASANFFVLIYNGWPFIEIFDMETLPRIACTLTAIVNFILPLSISCCYYILLLRCRGILSRNTIADLPKRETQQDNGDEVRRLEG